MIAYLVNGAIIYPSFCIQYFGTSIDDSTRQIRKTQNAVYPRTKIMQD
ncbi:hypothetical protein DOT_0758 [Desulfosporosinus sp. OT]|nr:hypothetical protein DOT_0758 [Desulfosporosinus sp. OT]